VSGQPAINQDLCQLSAERIRGIVDGADGRWRLTDQTLDDFDIQAIVNCTSEGDVISFETARRIQPSSRIVIPWQLTLDGNSNATAGAPQDQKATITCPSNDGLFLLSGAGVTLRNISIEGCDLSGEHSVAAIIEAVNCPSESSDPLVIELQHIDFTGNRNLGGSIALAVQEPSCYSVDMQYVSLESNLYTEASQLGHQNRLRNLSLSGNQLSTAARQKTPLFDLPQESSTNIHSLSAEDNLGTVFQVDAGVIEIRDSFFLRNSGRRGAIVAFNSSVSILTSLFDSNSCDGNGGAVFMDDGCNGNFTSVHFVNNSAVSGGALHSADSSDFHISSSIFERNSAFQGNGGALHIRKKDPETERSLSIVDSLFWNNFAEEGGGAISVSQWHDGEVLISGSTFLENSVQIQSRRGSSDASGGALHLIRSHDVEFTTVDSVFESNTGNDGGAIYFSRIEGEFTFSRTQFRFNQAKGSTSSGGGMYIWTSDDDLELILEETIFDQNDADFSGGAIGVTGHPFVIDMISSQFLTNRARAGGGGAVDLGVMTSLSIENCTFGGNVAQMDFGGALKIPDSRRSATISDSTFVNNSARSGGAICTEDDMNAVACSFDRNTASELGGAIYIATGGNVQFGATTFRENIAIVGGGIYIAEIQQLEIEDRCNFTDNIADWYGGAIYVHCENTDELFRLTDSHFTRNNATFGGAVFFQIDEKEDGQVSHEHVFVNRSSFVDNYAQRAGGALFIEDMGVFASDCVMTGNAPFSKEHGYFSTNFDCPSMQGNSVGEGGYGPNAATPQTSFYTTLFFDNGTQLVVMAGEALSFPQWSSGRVAPVVEITLLDHFYQGPAAMKLTSDISGLQSDNQLARYDDYARATMSSPDGLIPNPLIADVSNGTANITVGGPLQSPGDYSLVLWIGDNEATNIVCNVTLRECIVNEEYSRNGTLCIPCDATQFNFYPRDQFCTNCPDNANCSSAFTLPPAGYWNAFPCSDEVKKCIHDEACRGSNSTEVLEMLEYPPTDCNFTEAFQEWYSSSLCEEQYSGPLCGACVDSAGRVGLFRCENCLGNGVGVLIVLASIIALTVIVVLQVKGNLDSARHRIGRQMFLALSRLSPSGRESLPRLLHRTSSVPTEFSVNAENTPQARAIVERFREKEDKARWKFVELVKITMNFLQTVAAGISLDIAWNDLLLRLLETWDWVGGAAMETSSFSVDCMLPTDWPTPRSLIRQAVLLSLPVFVFLLIFSFWAIVAYAKKRGRVYLFRRSLLTAFVVLYVSYISLTKEAIDMFYCVDVFDGVTLEDGDRTNLYWAADTSVKCFEGKHMEVLYAVAIPLLLFAFFFPILLAAILISARRHGNLQSAWVIETLGLFCRGFEEKYVFWDSIILLRKAAIAAVVVFSYSLGGNLQGLIAVSVLMISLFLQTTLYPFNKDLENLNQLESLSLLINSFTFLIGVVLNDPNMNSTGVEAILIASVVLFNVGLTLLLLFLLVKAKIEQLRFGLLAEGCNCEKESGICVINMYVFRKISICVKTMKGMIFTTPNEGERDEAAVHGGTHVELSNQP